MIFSKDSKSPSASTVPNGATESRAAHGGVPSIISADLKIVGDLKSSGDMQIDGTVEGDIDSRMLTIGEGASVKGAIAAETVRISGSIVGQVKANSVILSKTAKVSGDITHQTLTMEAGAILEGGVRRLAAPAMRHTAPPPASRCRAISVRIEHSFVAPAQAGAQGSHTSLAPGFPLTRE
jgi:cytoskeletal protein CcmA (bactofilin family)